MMKTNKLGKKLLAILSAYPAAVLAGPSSGDVVGGVAAITTPNAQGTVINQTSAKAIINWQSFSIGSNEYVQFNQPSSSSVTLNRVTGGSASSILGNLSANGQVFLVNPNGVYFGAGATLDVGGLVASTMDIRNEDFMNGNYQFSSSNTGSGASVVNDGIIRAREQGYVVLAADRVENNGRIEAKYGKIALLSGGEVTLDIVGDGLVNFSVDAATATEMAGVENTGDLIADGGRVVLTGKVGNALVATAVNNSGLIQAQGIAEQDGQIFLTGTGGDISNSGALDASGTLNGNGGAVIIRTDGDAELTATSNIDASGDGSGAGGVVRVIADGSLQVRSGSLINAASGSAASALGGFVEVSGHEQLGLAGGTIELGRGGTLLIDPADVGIVTTITGANQILASSIETALNGNNVIIAATNSINFTTGVSVAGNPSYGGDLTVGIGNISAPCAGSSYCAAAATFTPTSGGTINLNSNSIVVNGDLRLSAQGGTINDITTLQGKNITLTANTITASSDSVNVNATRGGGGALAINGNFLATSLGSPDINFTATNDVTVNGNITATGTADTGSILVRSNNSNVTVNGNVSLNGTLSSAAVAYYAYSGAVALNGNTSVSGSSAAINITAYNGVTVTGSLIATATGSASINIGNSSATGITALNGNVTASGASSSIMIEGDAYGGAASVIGTGLLTAANISVYVPDDINIRTNSANITIGGDSSNNVGNVSVDNTALKTAATINLGSMPPLTAGNVKLGFGGAGTVIGDFTANSINVTSPGNLNISASFDVGAGYSGVQGDKALIAFLAANGITDGNGTSMPNASFISGGTLDINVDGLTQANRYLYLKADSLNISGSSAAPNLLVQMLPFTNSNSIGFEQSSPSTQQTNYTYADHFSHFTGTTIALGSVTQAGGISAGSNGPVNIGSKNLVFLTGTPGISGFGNVTGTGIIGLIATLFPEVLIDEVGGGGGTTPGDPAGGGDGGEGGGLIVVEGGGVKENLNLSCS